MTYTDEQLKRALAKMLPESVFYGEATLAIYWHYKNKDKRRGGSLVEDTELLHLCSLVEESLTQNECFAYDNRITGDNSVGWKFHAPWQKRTIAAAKVKGVEIV